MKIFCIDIDGTIFNESEVYDSAKTPNQQVIDMVNKLYDEGHFIRIYTARGYSTGIDWSRITYNQLTQAGVKFHEITEKPAAHYYVDDRNLSIKQFVDGDFKI